MDIALLLLRVVVGVLLVGHGAQKLFGAFGGGGIKGTAGFFEQIGFKPGRPMAVLAGLGEFAGGLLLALGLLNPLGVAAVIAVMLNASVPHWGKGPFVTNNGWELVLAYAAVAAAVGFAGPGAASLDNALGLELYGTTWGVVALVGGVVAGAANLALRAAHLKADAGKTHASA